MRQVFISYARDDREAVEALAARLRRLVDSVWFDSQLHGGEDWWAGILERVRSCDVFLAVVSSASLDSEACSIERTYARETGRTILPVALEDIPPALPGDLATVQIVDFSTPGEDAVADLARALLATPVSIPLPDPLPDEPPAPLSYLTSLVDLVTSADELTKSQQVEIVSQLERGLEASDPDERAGAQQVLHRMGERGDLASSVEKTIVMLQRANRPADAEPAPESEEAPDRTTGGATAGAAAAATTVGAAVGTEAEQATTGGDAVAGAEVSASSTSGAGPATTTSADDEPAPRRRLWVVAGVLAVLVLVVGGVWASLGGGSTDDPVAVTNPQTEAEDEEPEDPDRFEEDTETPPVDTNPCANPPGSFPGEVSHPTSSDQALMWQRILVREGVFRDDPANCNGDYTGPLQRDVVISKRLTIGLEAADGVLDEVFYRCLVDADCRAEPCFVPNVTGVPEDEAVAILREKDFNARAESVEGGEPFGVVREQIPPPGTELPCGDDVTIIISTLR